ncbi:MAG: hypothetical protein IPN76_00780 [Saprospiraceae bacterium]|nr:hypothetical protein [Saprospiraceae bacterium]
MWTIISNYTTQFSTCSMSAWTANFPSYCEANMAPIYAQFGIKILAAILLTLMFQSLKIRMNTGKLAK